MHYKTIRVIFFIFSITLTLDTRYVAMFCRRYALSTIQKFYLCVFKVLHWVVNLDPIMLKQYDIATVKMSGYPENIILGVNNKSI